MKQHITKEQWDELNKKQKEIYLDETGLEETEDEFYYYARSGFFNIGQMIEFLGNSIVKLSCGFGGSWQIKGVYESEAHGELCDALWEACKYKLSLDN